MRTESISILSPDKRATEEIAEDTGTHAGSGAATGALAGGILGGLGGWLVGIGALAKRSWTERYPNKPWEPSKAPIQRS